MDAGVDELIESMYQIADELRGESLPANHRPDRTSELGLTSLQMFAFLVEVEDRYGIVLATDLNPELLQSVRALAQHVLELTPDLAGPS